MIFFSKYLKNPYRTQFSYKTNLDENLPIEELKKITLSEFINVLITLEKMNINNS